jgi:predicted metal-binding protein
MVNPSATIFVCTNCPKDASCPTGLPSDAGEQTLAAVQQAVADLPGLSDKITVQKVKCMGGCETPCTVSFAGVGRETLVFSHMKPELAADIATCAATYVAKPLGERLTKPERPDSMKEPLLIRVPAVL